MKIFRSNKTFKAGMAIVGLLVFLALFGRWIVPYPPDEQNLKNALQTLSWKHPLGTDEFGRDILSRIKIGRAHV